jgi:HSP20 family molecular chaperone IbpA
MKRTFVSQFLIFALGAAVTIFTGCSKSGDSTAVSPTTTPTPTEMVSVTPTATVTPVASALPSAAASTTPAITASPLAGVDLRLRDLETRMDSVFADTFRNTGSWFDQSSFAFSADVQEQTNEYVARVYMRHGDTSRIDAKIDNGALHIAANNEQRVNGTTKTERYEQVINLPKPVQSDKIHINKKDNILVVTVPKTLPSAPAVASRSSTNAAASAAASPAEPEDTMFDQFARMQLRMDEATRDVFRNDVVTGASTSQLGSAMKVDDEKDNYVVHFYLPDRDVSNVNVKFDNGRLHLTAAERKNTNEKTADGTMQNIFATRYEEMITLPGPVKDKEMKVDRRARAVVVTLPKA